MESKHIKSSYKIIKAIVIATEVRDRLKQHHKGTLGVELSFIDISTHKHMTYDFYLKWCGYFEKELTSRRLRIPVVTRDTILKDYIKSQEAKRYAKNDFDKRFKNF